MRYRGGKIPQQNWSFFYILLSHLYHNNTFSQHQFHWNIIINYYGRVLTENNLLPVFLLKQKTFCQLLPFGNWKHFISQNISLVIILICLLIHWFTFIILSWSFYDMYFSSLRIDLSFLYHFFLSFFISIFR